MNAGLLRVVAVCGLLNVAIAPVVACRGKPMTVTAAPMQDETDRLLSYLSGESFHPMTSEQELSRYGDATRDELVAHLATEFDPPPIGRLLSRLPEIQTPGNRAVMIRVFELNLRSPDADARRASLAGLKRLQHPALEDFAISALRDEADVVVDAACYILIPKAPQDAQLKELLRNIARAHRGDARFEISNALLEGSGFLK